MPILVLEESNWAGPIPEDEILTAKITSIVEKKKPWQDDDGKDVIRMEFGFVVEDPDSPFDGQRIWGDTPMTFTDNPNCRLFAWAQEIMGQELARPLTLDTDLLVGSTVRVVAAQREYEKDGQKKVRNFVKDVIRAKGGSTFGAVDAEDEPF